MKYSYFKMLLPFLILTPHLHVQAEEAYAYCANAQFDYYWTGEKALGKWINDDVILGRRSYFIVDIGAHLLLKFRSECMKKYGNNFSYVLAAKDRNQIWYGFAVNENLAMPVPWNFEKYKYEANYSIQNLIDSITKFYREVTTPTGIVYKNCHFNAVSCF